MKSNNQLELELLIQNNQIQHIVPSLVLHSCCGPCSTYVIEYLSQFFSLTVFYYNPNIYPDLEYELRVKEQELFIQKFPAKYPVHFLSGDFDQKRYYEVVKGYELCKEGSHRCKQCYQLRLDETAKVAKQLGADYFATTLTISPMKNAQTINEAGKGSAEKYQVTYLSTDFKKKGGYQRSVVLSKQYKMYRQDYCGCVFSKREREEQKENDIK